MKKLNLPEKELQKRLDFLNANQAEIVKLWESNQPQRGYVQIIVDEDLKPYSLKFIAKNVKRSTFIELSKDDNQALCEILWDDTFTKNRVAFGYSFVKSEIQMN